MSAVRAAPNGTDPASFWRAVLYCDHVRGSAFLKERGRVKAWPGVRWSADRGVRCVLRGRTHRFQSRRSVWLLLGSLGRDGLVGSPPEHCGDEWFDFVVA
jgi:hypothetical protein